MLYKAIVLLCLSFAVLLPLSGCVPADNIPPAEYIMPSTSPSKTPEIVVPSGAAVSNIFGIACGASGSLNPITGISRLNATFMPLMYEGLFSINETYEAEPLLCERFTKEENTYVFYLNKDARFSDGSQLTAHDVVYSLKLAMSESSLYADRLKHVVYVAALGDDSVKVELDRNLGRFELLLDIPIIKKDTGSLVFPIGTGAYTCVEGEDERYLKANSDWWQKKAKPFSRIELIDAPEADLLINYFETGVIGMVANDPTATDPVVFGGDYEEWSYSTSIMYYLGVNAGEGPFRDAETRRMLTFAVDREFICEAEMLRYADPAVLPVNPSSSLYNSEIAGKYGFSLSAFADKLAAAGYDESNPLEVNFIVNSENTFKSAVANRIAEDLRTMGVTVNLRELKWDDYLKALSKGDFDIYLAEVRMTSDFDPSALISKEGALNYGKYSSDEMQALLDAYLSADKETIREAADALYRKIAEKAPIIPILFKRSLVMARRGLISGIEPLQSNIFNELKR